MRPTDLPLPSNLRRLAGRFQAGYRGATAGAFPSESGGSRAGPSAPRIPLEQVARLWLHRQGLATPRGSVELSRHTLTEHLERTGALQVDTINVVDRAHYLTLWSRFGTYDRERLDGWIYGDRAAYEYWGHEASILPISHLPLGLRRMRGFPPKQWSGKAWWSVYGTSTASKRRVLRRLREEGPLESADFEAQPDEFGPDGPPGGGMALPKEDKRSLKLLWHDGRVAVHHRRHFRCVYDLEEGFRRGRRFERELAAALHSLREHVGAERLELPEGWRRLG